MNKQWQSGLINSLLVSLCLLLGWTATHAQVVIIPQVKSNVHHIEQLYQVMLVNNGMEDLSGQLSIRLENNRGEVLFVATSLPTTLETGMARQSYQIQWPPGGGLDNFVGNTSISSVGRLPIGQFNICYDFQALPTGNSVGKYCHEFETKIAGVPVLVYPLDGSLIQEMQPVLQWLPPVVLAGEVLTYDLVMVALQANQTPAEGVARNAPVFTQRLLNKQQLAYPLSAPPLQNELMYAWQVTAYWNDYEVGKTDIWTFSKGELLKIAPVTSSATSNKSYPLLQHQISGAYHVVEEDICFSFQNRFASPTLNYRIMAVDALESQAFSPVTIALKPGWNKIAIPLDTPGMQVASDRYYYLEVIDGMGRKQYLKFKALSL